MAVADLFPATGINPDFVADRGPTKDFPSIFTDLRGEPNYLNILQGINEIQILLRTYGTDPLQRMPSEIKRFSEVYFKTFSKVSPLTVGQVKTSNIGQLVKIFGIVTHCSDVKPLMQFAVYTCEACCFKICQVAPGDVFEMLGIFLHNSYHGFRVMCAGLVPDTYLEAISYELTGDEQEHIDRLAEDGDIYSKLARSLAPEIFGHEDVKKGMLLLLVEPPHQKLADDMKIGGDPGVGRGQLLKHIINPSGVYTTECGSSVGLTAAVLRDPITSEFVIEGGALVLPDMGICPIYEFDKIGESDRTAIHEVTAQQTVSVAKAGMTTSLHAITAILAAANPTWGRYDMRTTLAENINLPPALLPRFNLLWLILDRAVMESGHEMARAYISAVRRVIASVPREFDEYITTAYSSICQKEANSNALTSYTSMRIILNILYKKYEEQVIYELKCDEQEQIDRLAEDGDIYCELARSLAREIFGHEDVKKALLLLLVGTPHRKLTDGMKIRGDLHICLMGDGDPGVEKSRLLKHIINIAPRGVYTTGCESSGIGLTAAVQKDPITGEFVLEDGALVLADMGICAIDEFDKMEGSDRTAIHEVMEQQTVGIAKPGITTSFNARTAVLAAANPAWGRRGRYDTRTPAENINRPPALLSRFDLLWLILDRADMESDLEMARHVVPVHQNLESPALGFTPLEPSVLRAYISAKRRVIPYVPQELEEYIATAYTSIHQEDAKSNAPTSWTLLSILRISIALARLRFSETVAHSDVDEALRLMQISKYYSDDRRQSSLYAISDIYSILRDEAARTSSMDVRYA